MKTKTIYACEKCGIEFVDDYDGCLKHESTAHTEPCFKSPEVTSYTEEFEDDCYCCGLYPTRLNVEMRNGAIVEYGFRSVIQGPGKAEDPLPQTEGLQEKEL